MLRVAVCDDDRVFLEQFSAAVGSAFEKKHIRCLVKPFDRCGDMLQQHREMPFDAVFLDIDMPGTDGFSAAKTVTEMGSKCYIIFVTSHSELVYDSFDFRPLNFITKDSGRLMLPKLGKVVSQISEQLVQDEVIVLENKEQGRFSVCLRDVTYIESDDHTVLYHIRNAAAPFRTREKLSALEEHLSDRHFVRIHKKYLVNLQYVFGVDLTAEAVRMKTGERLPASRSRKNDADRRLTEYLRRVR